VLGILVWQEGGEAVGALIALGAVSLALLAWWLRRRKRAGQATLLDPDLFKAKLFKFGVSGQLLQQIALGGTMIALPIYLQIVLEYSAMGAGLSIAPLSLSMFAVALVAGRRAGKRRPASLIRAGFALFTLGIVAVEPIVPRATSGWYLALPLIIAGSGLGLLVSQLNNLTLAPISEERVSEAAGVNSAGGSFGLSFGLAFAGAILLAVLSVGFTSMAQSSSVLSKAEQNQVAKVLEHDAEVVVLAESVRVATQLVRDPLVRRGRVPAPARYIDVPVVVGDPHIAALGLHFAIAWCHLEQTPKRFFARVDFLIEDAIDVEGRRELDAADRRLAGRRAREDFRRHWSRGAVKGCRLGARIANERNGQDRNCSIQRAQHKRLRRESQARECTSPLEGGPADRIQAPNHENISCAYRRRMA